MHNPNTTVPELLSVVRANKENYKIHELDALANEMGHEIVTLPPYHCQYNPIELTWAQVKGVAASALSSEGSCPLGDHGGLEKMCQTFRKITR